MSLASSRARCRRLASIAVLLTQTALANDPTHAADQHFSRGLAAAGSGKMTLAAAEFERAYDAAPHYSVLYNLGLVYAALQRDADAVRVLRRYLLEGGERVSGNRRKEVESIIQERSSGLGRVTLRVQPEDVTLTLDARTLDVNEIGSPLELDPGRHQLVVQRDGYITKVESIDVAAGEEVRVEIELARLSSGEPSSGRMVAFFVGCEVPDVQVSINGEPVDPSKPDAPRIIAAGSHVVRFSRAGYRPYERMLEIAEGQRVACRMRPLEPLSPSLSGKLELGVPRGSRVFVDGAPFGGGRVPYGRHRVLVAHDDFLTWQRDIEVPAGRTVRLEPELVFTPERRRREAAIEERRTWGVIFGAAGLGFMTTGAVLYVLNGERYEQWQADNAAFADDREASPAELKRQSTDLQQRAAEIQQLDDLALAVGGLGVVSLGVGAALYLSAPSVAGEDRALRARLGPGGFELIGAW